MRLRKADRMYIQWLYNNGDNVKQIAHKVGCSLPTIYRELASGFTGKLDSLGRDEYSYELSEKRKQFSQHYTCKRQFNTEE